jgi:hypothetical protein
LTAYAVYLARERVVVASDTAAFLPDRRAPRLLGHITKVLPLAHLRAAIFGRGMQMIITGAAGLVALSPNLDTIEKVAGAMPEALERATARYCLDAGIENHAAYGLVEACLAGWSETERRMRMWCWCNTEGWQPRDDDNGAQYGLVAMPRLPDTEMPPRRGSLDAQLVAVMKAERQFFEANADWGVMVGGEVQAWDITRDGLRQRVIHRFPDYGRPHDGADLLKRIMTGEEPFNLADQLFPTSEMRRTDDLPPAAARLMR